MKQLRVIVISFAILFLIGVGVWFGYRILEENTHLAILLMTVITLILLFDGLKK